MNVSRILTIFICVFFIGASQSIRAQSSALSNVITKEKVTVQFSTKYTFEDLVAVKTQLAEVDVKLIYELLKFDRYDNLSQINARIEYPDGKSASFSSQVLMPADRPGFRWSNEKKKR